MGLTGEFDRHCHLNRMARVNRETVEPSRGLPAEHRAVWRQREGFAEQSKGLRVAGRRNMLEVKHIHGVTMRLWEHRYNPAC
jgi:hypothetical protein